MGNVFEESRRSYVGLRLTVVYDWLFRPWYVFIVMELKTRRIVHTAVTNSPSDAWAAQQLREATPWGEGPEYLIHDHDPLFGSLFSDGWLKARGSRK